MTTSPYTNRSDVIVQGKVESSAQGKLIGAVDTMPDAKDYTDGVTVLYTGTTGTYVKGKYYRSNGISWALADYNLTVDSTPTSGSSNPVSSNGVYDALEGKQDNLTFDTAPKSGSLNPVTSGGLFTVLSNKLDKNGTAAKATADASGNTITTTYATKTEVNAKQDALSFDAAPTSGSANPVTSNGIYEALADKVDVVSGKGLSTNDYTTTEKNKLAGIATGAQVNVIETIKVNGTAQTPTSKAVNIDLSNYATKSDVSAIPKFNVTVVTELPTSGISTSTIYLKPNNGSGNNAYDEYIRVNDAWEKIGTTATDLSDYVTTSALNSALAGKQDTITAGTGLAKSGATLSLATTGVAAGSKGSATAVPVITVDSYGRVTELSSTTIYPPTTVGNSGQYWKSDGNGAGAWASPSTSPASGSSDLITSGAVHTALAGKQNNLTFDSAPAENSSNPVTSGGLYTMKANLEQAISEAKVNITGAATTIISNNLFANRALISSPSGKVAVSAVTSTELDYLRGVKSAIQTQLNSKISSIPSAGSSTQPIYINSSGVPTKCNYSLGDACAKAVTTSVTDGSTSLVTSGGVFTAVSAKQDKLTFDSTPTSGSSNPVTSGGVYSAINAIPQVTVDSALSSTSTNPVQNKVINTALSNKMDKATSIGSSTKPIYINSSGVPTACSYNIGAAASKSVDTTVTSGSSNLITSGAVYTAINNSSGSGGGEAWEEIDVNVLTRVSLSTLSVGDRVRIEVRDKVYVNINDSEEQGYTIDGRTVIIPRALEGGVLGVGVSPKDVRYKVIMEFAIGEGSLAFSVPYMIRPTFWGGQTWITEIRSIGLNQVTSNSGPLLYFDLQTTSGIGQVYIVQGRDYIVDIDLTTDKTKFNTSSHKFTYLNIKDLISRAWILKK